MWTTTLIHYPVQEQLCAGCGREPETMPVLSEGAIQPTEGPGLGVNRKVNWAAVEARTLVGKERSVNGL